MLIAPSRMTRWRKRLGETGAETMNKATIVTGVAMKAISLYQFQVRHINVVTTVQTKAIRYPAGSWLYDRAWERLLLHAREVGLSVKRIYERVGKGPLMKASRYPHARQMKRGKACTRKLRTNLGRVIREVKR